MDNQYTLNELEQMNEQLAEVESEAHNLRQTVLDAIEIMQPLEDDYFETEEEREVAEDDLDALTDEISDKIEEF